MQTDHEQQLLADRVQRWRAAGLMVVELPDGSGVEFPLGDGARLIFRPHCGERGQTWLVWTEAQPVAPAADGADAGDGLTPAAVLVEVDREVELTGLDVPAAVGALLVIHASGHPRQLDAMHRALVSGTDAAEYHLGAGRLGARHIYPA